MNIRKFQYSTEKNMRAVATVVATVVSFLVGGFFQVLHAQVGRGVVDSIAQKTGLDQGVSDVPTAIGTVLGIVVPLVGSIFFVLIVLSGIRWMTSAGNEEQITKAKKTLAAGVIGIVIVFFSYNILSFVIERLDQAAFTNSSIACLYVCSDDTNAEPVYCTVTTAENCANKTFGHQCGSGPISTFEPYVGTCAQALNIFAN